MNDGELIKVFMKLKRVHRKRCHDEFRKCDISKGQPKILNYLAENDGSIQKDIARNCNIEPATVTSILSTMEKAGFIERRLNTSDRRIINVYLTEKGKITQKNSQRAICEIEKECFRDFTQEEKEQAKSFFERMYNNLSKGEEEKND